MLRQIRRVFFAGLLVIIPIVTTVWVVIAVFTLFDGWFHHLKLLDGVYIFFEIPKTVRPYGLGFLTTVLFILGVGTLTHYWVGKKLVALLEAILVRVPVAGSFYSALKQVASAVLGAQRRSFQKVVFLQYPRKGIYSIGFVAREGEHIPARVAAERGADMMCLFVPTTPNPTSGVFVMAPVNEVIESDITVEQAMKMVISAGMVMPYDDPSDKGKDEIDGRRRASV